MSDGAKIYKPITHRCENFEENKKKVAGKENHEIRGGVLEDLVEKVRYTTNTGKTSIVTFHGIYDDEQGQGVFDREGVECWVLVGRQRNERTVYQRKREIDYLTECPWLVVTGPGVAKREVRKYQRFRNFGLPQKFVSKCREGYRTRMQRIIDRTGRSESNLYKSGKRQARSDPVVPPRHGIHPGREIGGWREMTGSCD